LKLPRSLTLLSKRKDFQRTKFKRLSMKLLQLLKAFAPRSDRKNTHIRIRPDSQCQCCLLNALDSQTLSPLTGPVSPIRYLNKKQKPRLTWIVQSTALNADKSITCLVDCRALQPKLSYLGSILSQTPLCFRFGHLWICAFPTRKLKLKLSISYN